MTLTRPMKSVKTVKQFARYNSQDQPQNWGSHSSQPRIAPTVVGRSESQRHESVGGNKAHEAADKESTGNIELPKVIKFDFSTHLAETRRDRGECYRDSWVTVQGQRDREDKQRKGCGVQNQGNREPRPGSHEVVFRQEWCSFRTRCNSFVFRWAQETVYRMRRSMRILLSKMQCPRNEQHDGRPLQRRYRKTCRESLREPSWGPGWDSRRRSKNQRRSHYRNSSIKQILRWRERLRSNSTGHVHGR